MYDLLESMVPAMDTRPGQRSRWGRLYGSSYGLVICDAAQRSERPLMVFTPDTATAINLEQECRFYGAGSQELPLLSFPDWETLPYDNFSPHQDIISDRLSTLYRLPQFTCGILIVPVTTIMHRLPPKAYLDANCLLLDVGDKTDIETLKENLVHAGYRRVSQVIEHGEFAVRGSIVDLFPMGGNVPYRLELFDDEVDTIRSFDTETQRSIKKVDAIRLLPAREFPFTEEAISFFRQSYRVIFEGDPQNSLIYRDVSNGITPAGIEYYLSLFFPETATLFDYLPDDCLLFFINDIQQAIDSFWLEIENRFEQRRHDVERPILPPQKVFLRSNEFNQQARSHSQILIQNFKVEDKPGHFNFTTSAPRPLNFDIRDETPTAKLAKFIQAFLKVEKGRILFVAETTGRRESLLDVLLPADIRPVAIKNWTDFIEGDTPLGITVSPLEKGLLLSDPSIAIIAESQLFGERVLQKRRRKNRQTDQDLIIRNLVELDIDSPVVHEEHGVGRYLGLETIKLGEIEQEFLTLTYAGGDKLFVPVSSLHLISRYTGASPESAPLHKLGSQQWEKAKRKARERVRDVAAELLDIYAKRAASTGFKFTVDPDSYKAFVSTFPFEETPDQEDAIQAVIDDMQSTKPMDRLICGDVGFGKTEVAMRAAFIAVQDGKQVSMLVPTTLLAQQHYENFKDRFADWPVQVASISRFRSKAEQDKILADLESGQIDIIVGTHKLIQKSVKFKRLGLVIIDEEHRFGVRQKERFKALRSEVDLLTLTATPIPRTLNMSLSGIQDLSIIASPPSGRLAVKTFVNQWSNNLIQEACRREIHRGGQIFFLHNEVETIEAMALKLEKIVPEADIHIAHGQMREKKLEREMSDFYHHRFNLLLCTTIIESGIDVPNANTIIMNRADRFGLAQLYQLRGRVGRSHHQAYAYLIAPHKKAMSADAVKRLEAIESIEDLGTGFTLATHDLEIRGAGEMLGDEQSGQIHEIGFTLYMDLLTRAVEALKLGEIPELDKPLDHGTEVDLSISALLPDSYLPDVHTRLIMYKRIASAANKAELRELQVEMIDRFGLLPDAAKNLFQVTKIKQIATPLGINKIEFGADNGRIIFNSKPNIDPTKIIEMLQSNPIKYKMNGPDKLRIFSKMPDFESRMRTINEIFSYLTTGN